jgi:hypothetical protein
MADAVPVARLPFGGTWNGIVGVLDVDPTTRTRFNVSVANGGDGTGKMATTATVAQINAALSSAGADQYVELAAGVFTVGGDINFTTARKTLRGQVDANGNPATTLRFSNVSNHVNMFTTNWDFGSTAQFTTVNVSSGATRGSTTLMLSGTPSGLTAGRIMWISAPKNAPTIDGGGWTNMFGTKVFTQVVKVTAVNGTSVTFTPAINADYISGLAVQVHYRTAASQLDYCGLENVVLECGTTLYFSDEIVTIQGGNQCWVKNCKLLRLGGTASLRAMIYIYGAYNVEVNHCQLAHCNNNSSSAMYCMTSLNCSGLLIVNNEFTDVANTYPILLTSGSAFAYNYCHANGYGAFQSQWVFHHGSHNHYNLFEGNWISGQHSNDETAIGNQSHSRNSLYVRERIVGKDTGATTNLNCILCFTHHDNVTVAACVLGTPGVQGYSGGNGGNTGEGIGYCFNFDTTSAATLLKLGNYNTANGAIPAAEITAMNGGVVQDSYLYTSKPSWVGALPWPWCDPTNYTQSNNPVNLPAGYRAINGRDPVSTSPSVPTNLRIIR